VLIYGSRRSGVKALVAAGQSDRPTPSSGRPAARQDRLRPTVSPWAARARPNGFGLLAKSASPRAAHLSPRVPHRAATTMWPCLLATVPSPAQFRRQVDPGGLSRRV